MKVHIEGDIYLTGDNMGYAIAKKMVDKDGQEKFSPISHWGSVRGAVEGGLLKLKLAESTAGTLRELIEEVREYKEFVRSKIEF